MNTFIIKKQLATEKTGDMKGFRKYVFVVDPGATKPEIKKAVREIYKVDSISVRITIKPCKQKRYMKGRQAGYKKAIVTLKEGQKIEA